MSLDPLRRWEQRIGALPMPSPLVWVVLVVAFLGFGVLAGRATSGAVTAASRRPLKLLVAGAPAATTPIYSIPATPTPPPAPEEAETEATPEAHSSAPSSSKASKAGKAGGSGGSTSQGGSPEGQSGSQSGGEEGASSKGARLPAIKHVFVVVLDDEPYATAFGPASPARYLTGKLEKQGELLVRYYAVAHEGLANEIALLSGQGPTQATATNCPTYGALAGTGTGANGQVLGEGCVYPASTRTLMGQLEAKHLTWKAYVEGAGACGHPTLGSADASAGQTAGYQTWRNPFVYFQAIAGSGACAARDAGMDGLGVDLAKSGRTANFSYIAGGPCNDGSPTPCAPGSPSGMAAADGFLRKVVPKILASKAYEKDGLLAITVDDAPASGEYADSSSCCGQPRFPNMPAASGVSSLVPAGGGQVGLLLLSPFIEKGGGLVQDTYNHFSLLATVERLFGLPKLGYAGLSEVKPLSPSLFSGG